MCVNEKGWPLWQGGVGAAQMYSLPAVPQSTLELLLPIHDMSLNFSYLVCKTRAPVLSSWGEHKR